MRKLIPIGLIISTFPLIEMGCSFKVKPEDKAGSITSNDEAVPLSEPVELATDLTAIANQIQKDQVVQNPPDEDDDEEVAVHHRSPKRRIASSKSHRRSNDEADDQNEDEYTADRSNRDEDETVDEELSPAQKKAIAHIRHPSAHPGGKVIQYSVKKGDTLMKISFELLGDLTRWREIYADNQKVIVNPNALPGGLVLNVRLSDVVKVHRNGQPYEIKKGDTLGKVSHWIYGTISRWKDLWKNNREMIHNPNWIYAGFKLYFIPPMKQASAPTPVIPMPLPQRTVASAKSKVNEEPIPLPSQQNLDTK